MYEGGTSNSQMNKTNKSNKTNNQSPAPVEVVDEDDEDQEKWTRVNLSHSKPLVNDREKQKKDKKI